MPQLPLSKAKSAQLPSAKRPQFDFVVCEIKRPLVFPGFGNDENFCLQGPMICLVNIATTLGKLIAFLGHS